MRIYDLCCKAGGAAAGLAYAFPQAEIIGIDIEEQPRYPYHFIKADIFSIDISDGDWIWASPPCQHYTSMLNHGMTPRSNHPDIVEQVRAKLKSTGKPWVIENVPGAPLLSPITLCGTMFNLRVLRHRLFESSFPIASPKHPIHDPRGCIRKQNGGGYYYRVYGHETGKREWGKAMGITWMKYYELAEAIPPAYSHYIAEQYKAYVEANQSRRPS